MVFTPPLGVEYGAMPPELNTARLQAGAGPAPMLQAAAGWEAWAAALEAQAAELTSTLTSLSGAWTGMGSDRGVAACMPMVVWLQMLATQAQKRAAQAAAQAQSFTTAATTTPQIPEIVENHVTHAVLEATNFLGVNTVPIGLNEMDYARMWDLAAGVMYAYLAETTTNALFEPIMPMTPIVIPGVGEGVLGAAMGQAAAGMAGAVMRDAVFTHVTGQTTVESVALNSGKGVDLANMAATDAQGAARTGANQAQGVANQATQQSQTQQAPQAMQQVMQLGSQVGSQAMQIPQQFGQMLGSNPMQQLTQPMQQAASMFSQMGGGTGSRDHSMQMGLLGASPLSNHPLAGGSGASAGSGLMRAASLPGMGGSAPRTPLMAKLIDKVDAVTPAAVEPVGAAAGTSATAGAAPVGAGGGGMGTGMGSAATSGGTKTGLRAPAPLAQDLGEDEGDDW
ncbi:PPE family protein [Mycobacterium sp.]|uniref:PPE family protein n=1 Tax=Mycobacterium sp. TaxID=1785 RepID=UPI0031E02DE6